MVATEGLPVGVRGGANAGVELLGVFFVPVIFDIRETSFIVVTRGKVNDTDGTLAEKNAALRVSEVERKLEYWKGESAVAEYFAEVSFIA